jgi:hypothetical protein
MKKILLMNVVLTAFTAMAGTTNVEVPKTVLYEFRQQFGTQLNAKWVKIDDSEANRNLFVAHFIQKGIWSEAYFEETGEFMGIGKNITSDQLPVKFQDLQQSKFKGYDVMEAYEYYLKDAVKPVYGLTIANKEKMIFLEINELGLFSVIKKEKYKN